MITGASSGMGRDLALAIAKRYKVEPEFWLVARRRQRMEALEKELSAYGLSSRILDLDLREDSSFEIISAMLKKERPRIMMLVNASGFGKLGAFSDMDEKAVSDMVELNCKALTRMCRICMPYMAAGGSSLIANYLLAALLIIISNAANKPEPELSSDTFQYEALAVLREHELKEREAQTQAIPRPRTAMGGEA